MDEELQMLVAGLTTEEMLELAEQFEQAAQELLAMDFMWPSALPESALLELSQNLPRLSQDQLEWN